jgi:hypothetical protein
MRVHTAGGHQSCALSLSGRIVSVSHHLTTHPSTSLSGGAGRATTCKVVPARTQEFVAHIVSDATEAATFNKCVHSPSIISPTVLLNFLFLVGTLSYLFAQTIARASNKTTQKVFTEICRSP